MNTFVVDNIYNKLLQSIDLKLKGLMISDLKKYLLISFLTAFFLHLTTYYYFGAFYGWIDDALINNFLRGNLVQADVKSPNDIFLGISYMIYYLYRIFPLLPWYGITLSIFSFLATLNTILLILLVLNKKIKLKVSLLLIIIGYFLFWIDNIFLVTLTRVSIILSLSSVFLLVISNLYFTNNKFYSLTNIYCGILFFIGTLIRPSLLMVEIPIIISITILFFKSIPQNFKKISTVITIVVLLTTSISIINSIQKNGDNQKIGHFLNITDGRNTYESTDYLYNNDILYKSFFFYFLPEDAHFNSDFFSKYGPQSWYQNFDFKRNLNNLKYEFTRTDLYIDEYHRYLNWHYKAIFLIVLNLILITISPKRGLQSILFILYISFLFFIMFVYKAEERLIIPLLTFQTLLNLICLVYFQKKQSHNIRKTIANIILLVCLFALCSYNIQGNLRISKEKWIELEKKKNIIKEINNNFQNKTFFFDMWSMSLIHQTIFQNVYLSSQNTYSNYREYWSFLHPKHNQYLKGICDNIDFISFFKCIHEKKEEYIFVYNKKLRVDFLEKIASEIYQYDLQFEEINIQSSIKNIHYSFLPYKYEFGFYKIKSFNKKNNNESNL